MRPAPRLHHLAVAVLAGLVVGASLAVWSGQQRHITHLERQVGLLERQLAGLVAEQP